MLLCYYFNLNQMKSRVEVVASPLLNRKVGCSRPTMILTRCLTLHQHYPALNNNLKIVLKQRAQQRFAVMSWTTLFVQLIPTNSWKMLLFVYFVFLSGKYKSIHEAVKAGDVVQLELLVKSGCSLNQIDSPKTRFTPLHWSAFVGSLEV